MWVFSTVGSEGGLHARLLAKPPSPPTLTAYDITVRNST